MKCLPLLFFSYFSLSFSLSLIFSFPFPPLSPFLIPLLRPSPLLIPLNLLFVLSFFPFFLLVILSHVDEWGI